MPYSKEKKKEYQRRYYQEVQKHKPRNYRKDTCACGNPKGVKNKTCRSCFRLQSPSGDESHRFKGGKHRTKAGYVNVLIDKRKYKLEHRIIMEEHLGRPLREHENVHHINGIKHDNRIENLELWTTSQPTGQRVEDKIRWAKQILEEYKDYEDNEADS